MGKQRSPFNRSRGKRWASRPLARPVRDDDKEPIEVPWWRAAKENA